MLARVRGHHQHQHQHHARHHHHRHHYYYPHDQYRNHNLLSRVGGHVEAHESDASDEDARQDQVEN